MRSHAIQKFIFLRKRKENIDFSIYLFYKVLLFIHFIAASDMRLACLAVLIKLTRFSFFCFALIFRVRTQANERNYALSSEGAPLGKSD